MTFRLLLILTSIHCSSAVAQLADSGSFQSAGVKIHYKEAGRGNTVILVHGLAASWKDMWPVSPQLTEKFHIVSLDQRGFGKSDKPTDSTAYGMEMVNDLVRLLDHLGKEKAHFVGFSLGGAVVAKLALTRPGRLHSATVAAPPPVMRPREEFEELAKRVAVGFLERDATPLLRSAVPAGQPLPPAFQVEAMNDHFFRDQDPRVLAACAHAMPELCSDINERKRSTVPLLAIVGSRDPVPMADLKLFIRDTPHKKFVVLEGRRHDLPTSQKFWDEVADFLLSQEPK